MPTTEEAVEALTDETKDILIEASQEAFIELVTDGLDEQEAKTLLVQVLDGVLAWKLFLSGPLAEALEAGDGPAIAKALEAIPDLLAKLAELLRLDPDKIEERAEKAEERGHDKVAERRYSRAKKVRARQEARED